MSAPLPSDVGDGTLVDALAGLSYTTAAVGGGAHS